MVACGRMTAKRLSLPLFAAIFPAALALWVSFGALAVGDGPGPSRIGVLPSPWWIVVTLAIVIAAVLAAGRRAALLWLSAIVLLPWLPLPVPMAALIWTGALRWWLWCAIATAL